jgi:Glyoxalase/Bleomycin resistance protein/Dioxygenase superfamily
VQPARIFANLSVPDIGEARDFYVDYLGLSIEGLNLGWVARFQSPDGEAVVQLSPATQPHHSIR